MANLQDIVNPFSQTKQRRFFNALQNGPMTAADIVSHNLAKTVRRIRDYAGMINFLDGVRVRCKGNPDDPKAVWEMMVINNGGALAKVGNGAPAPSVPTIKPSKPKKTGSYIAPPEFNYVKSSCEDGDNVFLVGPPGSGKTEMGRQIAKDLEATYIRQNFNGETTVDNMIGFNEVGLEEGASVTQWSDGELSRAVKLAIKGKKVVYQADEVTAGKPEVLFQFHRVLELTKDGGREMEVNGDLLEIPDGNLTIVATSNTFRMDETGLYQGTNAMNTAFANRWTGGVFFVDYPPNENEILEAHGVEARVSRAFQIMARNIRKKAADEQMDVICSTRQLIAIGKKSEKWGIGKAIEYVYLNTLTPDERLKVVDPVLKTMTFPK